VHDTVTGLIEVREKENCCGKNKADSQQQHTRQVQLNPQKIHHPMEMFSNL